MSRESPVADKPRPIGKDATGYEVITKAMRELLNQFPGLYEDEVVRFEQIENDGDIGFSNDSGALVYAEKKDVLGYINQTCQYPFFLVYRTNTTKETGKLSAFDFVDTFGKWLCSEPVTIGDTDYKLAEFPQLDGGRKIIRITRDNAYGQDPKEDGTQDWIVPVTVQYTNKFKL